MSSTKIWYITGASKGIGFALAKQLLTKGHRVAATSRSLSAFSGLIEYGDRFLALEVDLKSEASIAASIKKTVDTFGMIDVVVNNAGYGLGGAIEELSQEEIDENFEVNFFAVVRVIRQALPHLRKQRSGHIINIASIAGFAPGSGWAIYCAAKFAVGGLSEALANDLKPLGIHVTNVMPGGFRTNFARADSIVFSQNRIADYDYLRQSHQNMKRSDGAQLGDPNKVADAFIRLVRTQNPPVDLFLGSDAFARAELKIDQLTNQMNQWKEISISTDFAS
jgi:NAD(P)-dependent dehydrogenase (short-subunit alcohol dehydrogenase family)